MLIAFANRRSSVALTAALFVTAAVLFATHPALAVTTSGSSDLGDIVGNPNLNIFSKIWGFVSGPFALVLVGLIVAGCVWRMRQGFEPGETGSNIALALISVGMLSSIGLLWNFFHSGVQVQGLLF